MGREEGAGATGENIPERNDAPGEASPGPTMAARPAQTIHYSHVAHHPGVDPRLQAPIPDENARHVGL